MSVSLAQFLRASEQKLTAASIDNPSLDVRILVGHALGLDRTQMFGQSDRLLTDDEVARADLLLDRRVKREPVARILGEREFWSLPFGLNEATLEPRPDSETLVNAVLALIKKKDGEKDTLRILDLGTGTGCLLISLLHELPNATGLGIDIAPRAVEQAQRNAARIGVDHRAKFQIGDWVKSIKDKFDIIISNPPYIAHRSIEVLEPEVRVYDPMRALDGGPDGLDPYRIMIPQLPRLLKNESMTVFEIGYDQARDVGMLFQKAGFADISILIDYGGHERGVLARWRR